MAFAGEKITGKCSEKISLPEVLENTYYLLSLRSRSDAVHAERFPFGQGSDGRVARHSSAKAATAVRVRFRPQRRLLSDAKLAT